MGQIPSQAATSICHAITFHCAITHASLNSPLTGVSAPLPTGPGKQSVAMPSSSAMLKLLQLAPALRMMVTLSKQALPPGSASVGMLSVMTFSVRQALGLCLVNVADWLTANVRSAACDRAKGCLLGHVAGSTTGRMSKRHPQKTAGSFGNKAVTDKPNFLHVWQALASRDRKLRCLSGPKVLHDAAGI